MDRVELLLLTEVRRATQSGDARKIRIASQLSQPELAAACGVAASAVSLWERGQRTPKGEAGIRYARILRALAEHPYVAANDDDPAVTGSTVNRSADWGGGLDEA
jgi:DNA-binding transcriptional regulator YiaG